MLFFGHMAASVIIADRAGCDRAAAIAGSLLPDVLDKSASLLRLSPSRWLAHGLPFYALSVFGVRILVDGKAWRGFALGYAGHLLCDLWAGSRVPWWAPFQPRLRRRPRRKHHALRFALYLLPEIIGGAFVLRLLRRELALDLAGANR
jgi:hypothetical protein